MGQERRKGKVWTGECLCHNVREEEPEERASKR